MELAVRVARVNDVLAFRRATVATLGLGACRLLSKRNLVGLEYLSLTQQRKRTRGLHDDDAVGLKYVSLLGARALRAPNQSGASDRDGLATAAQHRSSLPWV